MMLSFIYNKNKYYTKSESPTDYNNLIYNDELKQNIDGYLRTHHPDVPRGFMVLK